MATALKTETERAPCRADVNTEENAMFKDRGASQETLPYTTKILHATQDYGRTTNDDSLDDDDNDYLSDGNDDDVAQFQKVYQMMQKGYQPAKEKAPFHYIGGLGVGNQTKGVAKPITTDTVQRFLAGPAYNCADESEKIGVLSEMMDDILENKDTHNEPPMTDSEDLLAKMELIVTNSTRTTNP